MPPATDAPTESRLALVVATSMYADPGLRQLRAPARDVADLAQILADPGVGGFAVTTVIDQPAHKIRLAIEDFLHGRGTQDLLLLYLSCHGKLDDYRRLYLAATDTRLDRLGSTGVESAWVLDQLEHCRARRQVLILDCCFSGAFAHGAKGEADLGLRDRFLGQGRGRVVLTASNATEYSFEGEPTDPASPAGSVFTAALVQGLRTGAADTDHDGHISVDDAYAYVFDQVKAAGAAQTPQKWLYGAEGRILLARSPAGPVVTPAPLPESLRVGLESPHPGIRIGAVTDLGEWLTGGDPARAATARRYLQEVADTDIPRVAHTASTFLGTGATVEPPAAYRQAREEADRHPEIGPGPTDVAQMLRECAAALWIGDYKRAKDRMSALRAYADGEFTVEDQRRCRDIVTRDRLLRLEPRVGNLGGEFYDLVLRLAFGRPFGYPQYCDVENCLAQFGGTGSLPYHRPVLEAIDRIETPDVRVLALTRYHLGSERLQKWFQSHQVDVRGLIIALAAGEWPIPDHADIAFTVLGSYLGKLGQEDDRRAAAAALRDNGYLAGALFRRYRKSTAPQVRVLTPILRTAYPQGLDATDIVEVFDVSVSTPALARVALRTLATPRDRFLVIREFTRALGHEEIDALQEERLLDLFMTDREM